MFKDFELKQILSTRIEKNLECRHFQMPIKITKKTTVHFQINKILIKY